MSSKQDRIITFYAKQVELVTDEKSGFAEASISINPNITWIRFVLLDDQPNANKDRVPVSEFDNVIRTGMFMPLKMGAAEGPKNHPDSRPLGVITHLVKADNLIEAIAALWNTEREDDVRSIKEQFKAGKDINLSWELQFTDYDPEENDVKALKNIAMNAATVVDIPAYGGRTNVTALASIETEEGNDMETIEKTKHDEIVSQLTAEVDSLKTEKTDLQNQLDVLTPEVEELRGYKSTVETEKQKVEKLSGIKARISDAGIALDEKFFTPERESFLLNLSDAELDFYVQDLVAFAKPQTPEASTSAASFGTKLPNLDKGSDKSYETVLDYLTGKSK